MSNNVLTETLSKISTMNNVEQSTYFNKTELFDIGDPVVFLYREHSMDSQRRLFGRNTTSLN